MSIPSYILEQLNSQANLVEIIGKHTTLKKAGREYKGCCPFHGEKTPSFYVNPQKNVYNCFGCNVGGNAFTFLQEYENLTFMEAALELSRQTGIDIPEDNNDDIKYRRQKIKSSVNTGTVARSNNTDTNSRTNNTKTSSTLSPSSSSLASDNYHPNSTHPNKRLAHDNQVQNNQVQNKQNHATDDPLPDVPLPDDAYTNQPDFYPPPSFQESDAHANLSQSGSGYDNYGYVDSHFVPPHESNFDAVNIDTENITDATHDGQIYIDRTNSSNLTNVNHTNNAEEGNLYDLLDNVARFYQQQLHNNPNALRYFKQRGLTDDTLNTFALGYAPSGWQHLEEAFPQDIEGLKLLGLIRTSQKGHDYDLLRERVIFPIRDSQGRIIGFAGRALDNDVKPKYINSSDSPVFHKQHILYGYFESRQHRANDWLVVEGYMDVIALYQAGIYGAVASMGTAVNQNQVARLLQYNPTLTLCFDGDLAGQKAAWRTLEISLPVLEDGKELRFLTLPGNHDPDTFIKAHGAAAMLKQIKQAVPLSKYVFAYLSERHDLSLPEGKAKLMSQVRSLTSQLPKGASFRYILNNDIYQRLGGRRKQKVAAHDALLDFDSDMTVSVQLELCLLFDPQILAEDPIQKIWRRSGVAAMVLPKGLSQDEVRPDAQQSKYQLPPLPSWQSFEDTRLIELVSTIKRLLPVIPKDINLSAHFILANFPNIRRQALAKRWHGFYQNLTERGIIDVSGLVNDLLVILLDQALNKQMVTINSGIIVTNHISKQRKRLISWHKEQQIESDTHNEAEESLNVALDLIQDNNLRASISHDIYDELHYDPNEPNFEPQGYPYQDDLVPNDLIANQIVSNEIVANNIEPREFVSNDLVQNDFVSNELASNDLNSNDNNANYSNQDDLNTNHENESMNKP